MATVRDILSAKESKVVTIGKDATVLNAAIVMNEHRIGALVVVDQSQVVGMFTERDILQRVVGQQRDPAQARVADVMTSEVACATPETTIEESRGAMKNRRIRHLPVLDRDGKLLGIVSIGDLNAFESATKEHTIHLLESYLYGRA